MNRLRIVKQLLLRLAVDQRGNAGWLGLVLTTVLLSLGCIVGLNTYRSHLVQQFGDAAVALRNLRQTYDYTVLIDVNRNGSTSDPEDRVLQGSFTAEVVDLFDPDSDPTGTPSGGPAELVLDVPPEDENPLP